MLVDELIALLQALSRAGHGERQIAVVFTSNPARLASISKVIPPDPDPDSEEPDVRETAWLVAYPSDFDGMPYAPEYLDR